MLSSVFNHPTHAFSKVVSGKFLGDGQDYCIYIFAVVIDTYNQGSRYCIYGHC